jgi:hypothetical protein
MTHPAEIALLRFAEGEHSKETAAHLADCASCRSVVQESREVGAALRTLSAPPPPPWLGRITPVHAPRWHAIAAMFVAGILVGGTATYVGESDLSLAGLMPITERPALPTAAHPVGPGRWTYLTRSYVDSVLWANAALETVTVDASATEWIIVTSSPAGERDSLRVSRRDLTPLSATWGPPRGKVSEARQFTRDSVIFSAWTATRTHRVAFAVADSGLPRLYFRTVALDRHWHRKVRLLMYWDWDRPRTLDLTVAGRRTISTPVGNCDCWQVAFSIDGRPNVFWVRAEDGVVVKTDNIYGVTELVAEDPLPT